MHSPVHYIRKSVFALTYLFASASADAQLVEDTNVVLGSDSSGIAGWALTVDQFAIQGFDETSVFFDVDLNGGNAVLTFVDMNLDEGSDWHEAETGDLFNLSGICNVQFPFWGGVEKDSGGLPHLGGTLGVAVGQPFCLGINTGDDFVSNDPARNHFGWVELEVLSSGDVSCSTMQWPTTGIRSSSGPTGFPSLQPSMCYCWPELS